MIRKEGELGWKKLKRSFSHTWVLKVKWACYLEQTTCFIYFWGNGSYKEEERREGRGQEEPFSSFYNLPRQSSCLDWRLTISIVVESKTILKNFVNYTLSMSVEVNRKYDTLSRYVVRQGCYLKLWQWVVGLNWCHFLYALCFYHEYLELIFQLSPE